MRFLLRLDPMKLPFLSITFAGGLLLACSGDAPPSRPASPPPAPAPAAPAAPTPAATPAATPAPDPAPAKAQDPAPAKKPTPRPRVDHQMVVRLFGNDPTAPEPEQPSTPERVALGKVLYHETALSEDGSRSCNSCHDLGGYGVPATAKAPGAGGRDVPTVYNAFRQFRQFRDGRAAAVEDVQVLEHGLAPAAAVVAKIKAKPELVQQFTAAFPGAGDAVTEANVAAAIGAFVRTLTTRSKWDDYLDGNQRALDNDELLGLKTFLEVGCTTCHVNRTLGGHMYQKLGLLQPYATEDTGRMKVTGSEADKYFFKVSGLLNVEKTAPYYHDGKIATLSEAVRNMAKIQLARDLTDEQVAALVAFLKALTGKLPEEFTTK
jgi:cytochrome c peroxidase